MRGYMHREDQRLSVLEIAGICSVARSSVFAIAFFPGMRRFPRVQPPSSGTAARQRRRDAFNSEPLTPQGLRAAGRASNLRSQPPSRRPRPRGFRSGARSKKTVPGAGSGPAWARFSAAPTLRRRLNGAGVDRGGAMPQRGRARHPRLWGLKKRIGCHPRVSGFGSSQ